MNETNTGIPEEKLLLYELSLTIGQTLDPYTTCRDFLNILFSTFSLNNASIWWLDHGTAERPANELILLDAVPRPPDLEERLSLTHPYWQHTRDEHIWAFTIKDAEFASLVTKETGQSKSCTLFPLGKQGVLVLYSASPSTFTPSLLDRLRTIINTLATAIRGGMAAARLQTFETQLEATHLDLAEAKHTSAQYAAQLANANSHLQTLIHALPDLVWLKDPEGTYLACNNRFERFFGASEKEIIGKTDFDFVDKDLADFFRSKDRSAIEKGGQNVNEEWLQFANDGHRELIETTKTPMFDTHGTLIGVLGIGHDITDRKQTEDALRVTEERSRHLASMLRLMCDNVPDLIWAKDLEKRYLFANKALCEQLLNAENIKEPLRKTDLFFAQRERHAHPDNPDWHTFGERCQDSDAITLARGKPSVFEESGQVKGQHLCLEVHKSPFRNEKGEVIGTVGSARNITDRKKIEAELAEHRQHLEELVQQRTEALITTEARASHILQSTADGLYGVDSDGRITFINPAACRMLGYRVEEVIGRCAHTLFHHSRSDGTTNHRESCPGYHALLNGHEFRIDDEDYWHADGHSIPVMYAIHPSIQDGKTSGAVVSFVDISEQRAATQARERALIAAEHLARVKSEFLANMSHEIRTPLNGVLGFAQIGYRNVENSEMVLNAFEQILASGKRLLGVVNDILDFSKIEDGKLSIDYIELSLADVIDTAVDLVRDRARSKHLDLTLSKAPNLPETCISDPLRLGQILLNLLTNAIKFTDTGSVTLSASRDDNELVFCVTDTGIGIDNEHLSLLFNPFRQIDGSSTRRFEGTGLGLAISKQLLDLMNGRIRVESHHGIGSTFEFRLPLIDPGSATANPTPTDNPIDIFPNRPLMGVSILVAEDDDISQMVLEHNLQEDGAHVVMVSNGHAAVERITLDGPNAYDIVLMDVQMPEMNGYQATQRIIELAPDLPIIGQTAHAYGDERERCFAAGMVGHIAKPIDPDTLVKIVLQLVSARHNRVA